LALRANASVSTCRRPCVASELQLEVAHGSAAGTGNRRRGQWAAGHEAHEFNIIKRDCSDKINDNA